MIKLFPSQNSAQSGKKKFILSFYFIWTLLIAFSLLIFLENISTNVDLIAKTSARAYFNKDQAFRFWSASHGGVYVPVTERTQPNKNLSHIIDRDIEKPNGTKLTLMNPAYMIRQMMNDYSKLYEIRGKITSLKYLHEGNKPDKWERNALISFESGKKEAMEYEQIDNQPYLRLMRPMITKKSCLKCHAYQDYKVGDIRGGVGVSVPLKPIYIIADKQKFIVISGHFIIWLLVLITMLFFSRRESIRLKTQGELEQKLKDSKAKFEEQRLHGQKMEAIGTLAGGIAHDFNNILGVIMGYTELTIDNPADKENVIDNLHHVMKASERAKDMVQQILAFSRKSEQTMKSVNIEEIIKETMDFLRSSVPTTIEIRSNVSKNPGQIFGNATQINQILMNLCTNATYAMKEEGGVLEIGLEDVLLDKDSSVIKGLEPGKYQHLSVSDTGTGISKEIISRIFEPYFTTKNVNEGSGMGLAVIYGIIKSHKGVIKVYSEPGKGTVFNVYFPVIKTEKAEESDTDLENTFLGNNEMVLLVDDEVSLAELNSQMLKNIGYRVDSRTSSIEALEAFKTNPDKYDLIVTDMTMPGMTGVILVEKIHKIKPDIPVIICTGFSTSINKNNFESKGINALIMKPIVKRELAAAIREVLSKSKKQNF